MPDWLAGAIMPDGALPATRFGSLQRGRDARRAARPAWAPSWSVTTRRPDAHADCAKVGITSIRRDLPADISTATLNETIDELNANPTAPVGIASCRCPSASDENAVALERVDLSADADGAALDQPAGHRRRCRVPARHCAPAALRHLDRWRACGRHRSWCRRWAGRWGCC